MPSIFTICHAIERLSLIWKVRAIFKLRRIGHPANVSASMSFYQQRRSGGETPRVLTREALPLERCAFRGFIKPSKTIVITTLMLLWPIVQGAQADDSYFKITVGAEYSTGDYGGTESIDEWYVPVTGKYIIGRYVVRLTIPYLRLTAPSGTTLVSTGQDGEVITTGSGSRTTEAGLGDIIAGLTYEDLFNTELSSDIALDLTGKIKFGTADENKGLGTGENDYTIQADLFKFYDQFTPYGTLGYKFRGDPSGVDLDNVWFGIIGGLYEISPKLGSGLDFYYREASFPGASEQQELTAHFSYRLTRNQKVQVYGFRGFSNGSPDWGGGVMVTFNP
jgi:hypothetical protein